MTQEAIARRRYLDHERYLRNQEERKKKQREYYAMNMERCKAKVRECQKRRRQREYEFLAKGIMD